MVSGAGARRKGHTAEQAVARYLKDSGFQMATTSRGTLGHDGTRQPGDIVGTPGSAIEVKNCVTASIGPWLLQAAIQAGPDKVPVLMMKPRGKGLDSVGDWWAITYVRHLVPLLPREGDL
jgi:hypothetical protein